MNLTPNEAVILSVLSDGSEKFGLEIYRILEKTDHKLSSIGSMYTLLARLHKKDLVKVTPEKEEAQENSKRGGKKRHYIEITGKGQEALEKYKLLLKMHQETIFVFTST